jgi:single-strand DNA-binding protein
MDTALVTSGRGCGRSPRAALLAAGGGVLALTAGGALLGALDPALGGHARPHPTLTGSAVDALSILENNARVLATPFSLLLFGFPASRLGRRAGDLILLAVAAASAIPVGIALGRWQTRLLPYIPQLPLEWAALSIALSTWLLARTHRPAAGQFAQRAAATALVLVAAAAVETWATPHRVTADGADVRASRSRTCSWIRPLGDARSTIWWRFTPCQRSFIVSGCSRSHSVNHHACRVSQRPAAASVQRRAAESRMRPSGCTQPSCPRRPVRIRRDCLRPVSPTSGRTASRSTARLPSPRPKARFRVRPPAGVSGYVNHRIPTRREPKMSASAPAVNSVALVGNLTADPVLKQLDDDRRVCNLRIAVNDVKDQPMFIDVAAFGAQADACAKYLAKGRAIAVTGRLVYREWDDNGTRRSRHQIVGRVQFGGKPDEPDATETADTTEEVAAF